MTQSLAHHADRPASSLRNRVAFDRWADSYDTEINPLLLLEQRYLERMLPDMRGLQVLDAGCGSGRWLQRIAKKAPCVLSGMDSSAGMLAIAAQKKIPGVHLVQCLCHRTPFSDNRFGLILSSFLLSYVSGLALFAEEMTRVAHDKCDLFLSDMHPVTQRRLGWKRGFHSAGQLVELETVLRSIDEIIDQFLPLGWSLGGVIEPEFGDPERQMFAAAGRMHRMEEAAGLPVIYLLHLRKTRSVSKPKTLTLHGATCVFGPHETAQSPICIAQGSIEGIGPRSRTPRSHGPPEIDLTGYSLLPGLINAHDHLEFALFPRLGRPPYSNASQWAEDIHKTFADQIARHRAVPKSTRLWWGALRNLLCGVTTVCHHNPREPEFGDPAFPIRVIRNFGWAHSLAYGGDLCAARSVTPPDAPFVLHACEGIDGSAGQEVCRLDQLGLLDEHAVIVHGLALDHRGRQLMQRRNASLVICPSSNAFLFGELPSASLIASGIPIALGSDSPLTACGDLLDEVRFAVSTGIVDPSRAYAMVTDQPASILRMKDGEGAMRAFGRADLIAIRDTGAPLMERLRSLSAADIELVIVDGVVRLASEAMLFRLPHAVQSLLHPLTIDGMTRWMRAPIPSLLASAEAVLGLGQVKLGGKALALPMPSEPAYGR